MSELVNTDKLPMLRLLAVLYAQVEFLINFILLDSQVEKQFFETKLFEFLLYFLFLIAKGI